MPNGRALRFAGLFCVAWLGALRARAAEHDAVRVRCGALTADDAAQVEARLRATLLTAATGTTNVRIDCDANIASVTLVAGERTESAEVVLPLDNPREPLLAAIERLLVLLEEERRGTPPATSASPEASKLARTPEAVAPPVVAPGITATPVSPASPAEAPHAAARWAFGAGALGEIWDGAFAYGVRLHAERRQSSWALGAAFGWLTTTEMTDVFRTNELHGFVFGALEEARTTGLRASLGIGASTLTIRPEPDVVATTPTALTLVFFDAALARPVRFGRAWLLPAVAVRFFPARREVTVDAERRLVLPPMCPALFLGGGFELE